MDRNEDLRSIKLCASSAPRCSGAPSSPALEFGQFLQYRSQDVTSQGLIVTVCGWKSRDAQQMTMPWHGISNGSREHGRSL